MKIALIAGETSGDILGASLIRALRERYPEARFYGVAGPRMVAAGCEAIESIEALSVMGLAEVLKELPRLFRLRASLVERFVADSPDCVIGIDAPDFNLGLERRLRERGLRTVHFVSPTVWAWRQGRVRGIARSCELMLCLFPFEADFYREHAVRVAYVGHPLADELNADTSPSEARSRLGLPPEQPCVAVLPGSRASEVDSLMPAFAEAARRLAHTRPALQFVVPVAKPKLRGTIESAIAQHAPELHWRLLDGQSREAMQAGDAVLLASGTATLECLLLGRPMAVAYRVAPLTAFILRRLGMLKIERVSLPNLLCPEPVVEELLQEAATGENLAAAVGRLLDDAGLAEHQRRSFATVRETLRRDAAAQAAQAISALLS